MFLLPYCPITISPDGWTIHPSHQALQRTGILQMRRYFRGFLIPPGDFEREEAGMREATKAKKVLSAAKRNPALQAMLRRLREKGTDDEVEEKDPTDISVEGYLSICPVFFFPLLNSSVRLSFASMRHWPVPSSNIATHNPPFLRCHYRRIRFGDGQRSRAPMMRDSYAGLERPGGRIAAGMSTFRQTISRAGSRSRMRSRAGSRGRSPGR